RHGALRAHPERHHLGRRQGLAHGGLANWRVVLMRRLIGVIVTLILVAVAAFFGWQAWIYYTLLPWTRDAPGLAYVVEPAPDVSGLISAINVVDNQVVHKGDVLFVIDQERFKVAVEEAQAVVLKCEQALRLAEDDARRYASLRSPNFEAASAETIERYAIVAEEARADLQQAQAAPETAQINLTRSQVRAPADG